MERPAESHHFSSLYAFKSLLRNVDLFEIAVNWLHVFSMFVYFFKGVLVAGAGHYFVYSLIKIGPTGLWRIYLSCFTQRINVAIPGYVTVA